MSERFYVDLPVTSDFSDLLAPSRYHPLPEGWMVGLTDVISSTAAIAEGRYKTVNMAGASAVAALMNALETMTIPFVFGGDGASFAIHADHAPVAREALARTCAFVRDEFDLDLRAALVPITDIRAAGKDVLVARFGPSRHVSYAMFRGGGMNWATEAMKRGDYAIMPAEKGVRPDLSGLSCRFEAAPATHGVILSVIVVPMGGETAAFDALSADILALAHAEGRATRPFASVEDLKLRWPGEGLDLEVRINHVAGYPMWLIRLERLFFTRFASFLMNGNRKAGQFDAKRYKGELIVNADYRKFDDGLRLTLDCTPELADALEARLVAARAAGIAQYGVHRQQAAIMTCFVPSASHANHIHFIDGASGGYAAAAKTLKTQPVV